MIRGPFVVPRGIVFRAAMAEARTLFHATLQSLIGQGMPN